MVIGPLGVLRHRHGLEALASANSAFHSCVWKPCSSRLAARSAALAAGGLAQHHGDQLAAVARGAGDHVEAAVADEAGLHAVGARVVGEQAVVGAQAGACRRACRASTTGARTRDSRAPRRADSLARSRAVVTCSGAGRPLALANLVRVMPRRAAVAFMRSTKASCEPRHRLRQHHGDVVGRLDDERLQRRLDRHVAPTGRPTLLGGWLAGELRAADLARRASACPP